MATLQKGLIQRQDQDNYDGTLATSRTSSTGGTTSGLKVGDSIDVLSVYGSGTTANQTRATIADATGALGSGNHALSFAPGTWTIDDDITIGSNFTVVVPAGCVFSVASGKTLTIQGVLFRQHATYTAGAGTVTASGTDLLAATGVHLDYDDDTGVADAYVITPASAPSAYTEGQTFRFKAGNANTGASTINVNGVGVKSIVARDGSTELPPNAILASQIYTVVYEDTGDNFHLMDGESSSGNVFSDTDSTDDLGTTARRWANVYADSIGDSGQGLDVDATDVRITDGVLLIKEQAEADADQAGYGQVWVDTATPNTLMFTDDAGTDHQVPTQATQAAIEAETDENTYIPPDLLKHGLGVAKARVTYDHTAIDGSNDLTGVDSSFGVTGVVDGGTGLSTINWATAFSAAGAYSFVGMASTDNGANRTVSVDTATAASAGGFPVGSVAVQVETSAGANGDAKIVCVVAFGDQ